MKVFNSVSLLTIVGIFIVGIFIYPNQKKKEHLLSLGSFCQTAAFFISFLYCLKKYESIIGPFAREGSNEFLYFVTLNLYGAFINLVLKIVVRFRFKDEK